MKADERSAVARWGVILGVVMTAICRLANGAEMQVVPWSEVTLTGMMPSSREQTTINVVTDASGRHIIKLTVLIGRSKVDVPESVLRHSYSPDLGSIVLGTGSSRRRSDPLWFDLIWDFHRDLSDGRTEPVYCTQDNQRPEFRIEVENGVVASAWTYDGCFEEAYEIDPQTGNKSKNLYKSLYVPEEHPPYDATPSEVRAALADCSKNKAAANICAWDTYHRAVAALDEAAAAIRKSLVASPVRLSDIERAQSAWHESRNADCDFEALDADGPAMLWSVAYECRTALTRQRTELLKGFASCAGETDCQDNPARFHRDQ